MFDACSGSSRSTITLISPCMLLAYPSACKYDGRAEALFGNFDKVVADDGEMTPRWGISSLTSATLPSTKTFRHESRQLCGKVTQAGPSAPGQAFCRVHGVLTINFACVETKIWPN